MDNRARNARLEPGVLVGILPKGAAAREYTKVRTTGSITLPYEATETTQHNLNIIISTAKATGYKVPDHFLFSAGQVFYRDRYPEEVRLSGSVLGKELDAEGRPTGTIWTTPTSPRLMEGSDGVPILDPMDMGRMHFSGLAVKDQKITFLWDLRTDLLEINKIAPIHNAFPEDTGRLPNNPLVAAGMAAICKGGPRAHILLGGWRENEAGRPMYQHTGIRGGRIFIYPNPVRNATDPLTTTESLWAFVKSLNPFTGDVALAVLAQLCEPSMGDKPKYPLLESVRISADAILGYKGIQRWGNERHFLQRRVSEEMERLRALYFDVEKWPTWNPRTGKWDPTGASWQGDRLFDIVKVEMYQENLFGEKEQIEVSWLVRAGQWAYWWLNAQGRVWIARMARALLEIDHRENRGAAVMAKKIGQRLALLGGAVQYKPLEPLRVDHLLESIGELPIPEERTKNWAGRTRERFDEAMFILQRAGVLSSAEWPDDHGPGDPDRSRGWVERWLSAHVGITLPEVPPGLPATERKALPPPRDVKRGGRPKKPAEKQGIDGGAIRQARKERNLSQEELARYLGIDRTYLSLIESEKRLPPRELACKIQAWLEKG